MASIFGRARQGFALGCVAALSAFGCGASDRVLEEAPPSQSSQEQEQEQKPPADVTGRFGIVYPVTGLTASQCGPLATRQKEDPTTGELSTEYFTGLYSQAQIDRLKAMVLADDSPHKAELPYLPEDFSYVPWDYPDRYVPAPKGSVCGLKIEDDSNPNAIVYSLKTYPSADALEEDVRVTHSGRCGYCSTMDNLAVLLEHPDRASAVRECAMMLVPLFGNASDEDALRCIQDLGYQGGCDWLLYFNAHMTKESCQSPCVKMTMESAPYHDLSDADLALHECLTCDAEVSEPIYSAIAGRRDQSQPISMCRVLGEDEWICHNYADDFDNPNACIGVGEPKQEWVCTVDDFDSEKNDYDLNRCVKIKN